MTRAARFQRVRVFIQGYPSVAIVYWLSVAGRIRQSRKAQPGRAISGFKISPSRPDKRKPGASLADA